MSFIQKKSTNERESHFTSEPSRDSQIPMTRVTGATRVLLMGSFHVLSITWIEWPPFEHEFIDDDACALSLSFVQSNILPTKLITFKFTE